MTSEEKALKELEEHQYIRNLLCDTREVLCEIIGNYGNKKGIDYSLIDRGKKLLNKRIYKNNNTEESCPDCFCEDCTKECGIKKLGLV